MGQEGNKSCWASKAPRDKAIQLEQSALSCRIIAWLALSFTQILELGKSFGHKSEKGVLICSPKSMNRLAWEDALTVPGCPRATAARPPVNRTAAPLARGGHRSELYNPMELQPLWLLSPHAAVVTSLQSSRSGTGTDRTGGHFDVQVQFILYCQWRTATLRSFISHKRNECWELP